MYDTSVKLLKPSFPKLGLFFSALFISILTAEFLLRLFGFGYGSAPLVSDSILHHRHPKNYSMLVHDPGGEFGGHSVYYDSDGLVSNPDRTLDRKDSSLAKYRIAFMGDSFVEATQVPFKGSFFGRLFSSAKDEVSLQNYGTSSYSPILYFLQYKEVVQKFKPTHIFLMLYSNDISDDLEYFSKAVFSPNGEIIKVPGLVHDIWKQVMRNSYLIRCVRMAQLRLLWMVKNYSKKRLAVGSYVEENPEISSLSESYVLKLANEAKKNGAQFTLLVVPSKYRLTVDAGSDEPEFLEKWRVWAQKHGIDFLDLVVPFHKMFQRGAGLFVANDIHFNSSGHQVIVQEIENKYPDYFIHEPFTKTKEYKS